MSDELALPPHPTLQVVAVEARNAAQSDIGEALTCRWGEAASKLTVLARSRLLSLPPSDVSEHIKQLSEYLSCVCTLEQTPMQKETKKLAFQWLGIAGTLGDLASEKGIVLVNIASNHARVAGLQHLGTPEGLKIAAKSLSLSAGFFGLVKEIGFEESGANGSTLGGSINHSLQNMMLGQAQECLLGFAILRDVSLKNRAVLANQTAVFYQLALAALAREGRSVAWRDHLTLRHKLYTFLAHCYNGACLLKLADDGDLPKYGEAIAHLRLALQTFPDAKFVKKHCQKIPDPAFHPSWAEFRDKVATSLPKLEKSNMSVYLQHVPAFDKLEPVPKAEQFLAKPIVPTEEHFHNQTLATACQPASGSQQEEVSAAAAVRAAEPAPTKRTDAERPTDEAEDAAPAATPSAASAASSGQAAPQMYQGHFAEEAVNYPTVEDDATTAARMGISLKAYRVQKEQQEYERRKAVEGGGASADWQHLLPTNAEEEEAQLARILEASLTTR